MPSALADDGDVVLVMGIPGAGKSRVAEDYVTRGYARLNRDERGGTLRGIAAALDEHLASGVRQVVLDNTYLTRATRSYVIEVAGKHGVAARCIWLDTPLAQAQVNLVERLLSHDVPAEIASARSRTRSVPVSSAPHEHLTAASCVRRSVVHDKLPNYKEVPMKLLGLSLTIVLTAAILLTSAAVHASPTAVIPLKDAKLNIEHNATDNDTGFQGFIDSEGWRQLDVRGPGGQVLAFEGRGSLAKLGVTELFFETVEPANADVAIDKMLAKLPRATTRSPVRHRRTARASAARPAPPGSRTTSRRARSSCPPGKAPKCPYAVSSRAGSP